MIVAAAAWERLLVNVVFKSRHQISSLLSRLTSKTYKWEQLYGEFGCTNTQVIRENSIFLLQHLLSHFLKNMLNSV